MERLTIEKWHKDVHEVKLTDGSMTPQISEAAYMYIGLNGESGELGEKLKKIIRDNKCSYTEHDKELICKELGDILWYLTGLAETFGISIQEIIEKNWEKIMSRQERGKLHGSGDER